MTTSKDLKGMRPIITNAQRQAAYKERMRKAGYQQVTLWIQPERKEMLYNFAATLREVKPIYHNNGHGALWCFPEN